MSRAGSFRLFRLADIDVYVHWTWLLIAFFEVQYSGQPNRYDRAGWNWIEFLSLFAIVLMHEFGHALACRQVGGIVHHIILWPLGGTAYVSPPPQPRAVLWSIAAGPLVNVFLVPLTVGLWLVSQMLHWGDVTPDFAQYLFMMMAINFLLLFFNMLPVYPLDGGQILHALLWFVMGRARSLMFVSVVGIVVGGCVFLLAMVLAARDFSGAWWLGIMAAFVAFRAVNGLQHARMLARVLSGPRHKEAACPSCGVPPLAGNYWTCDECGTRFDTFQCHGQCPGCGQLFRVTKCPECYKQHPIGEWLAYGRPPDDSPQNIPH